MADIETLPGPARAAPPSPGVRLSRALGTWLLMLIAAVANGILRDLTYGPQVSELAAHQVSTLTAAVLLGLVIRFHVRRWPPRSGPEALGLGLLWVALTVAFEFGFFHYAAGHPWSELLAAYDLTAGRVWGLLLLWISVAPSLLWASGLGRDGGRSRGGNG